MAGVPGTVDAAPPSLVTISATSLSWSLSSTSCSTKVRAKPNHCGLSSLSWNAFCKWPWIGVLFRVFLIPTFPFYSLFYPRNGSRLVPSDFVSWILGVVLCDAMALSTDFSSISSGKLTKLGCLSSLAYRIKLLMDLVCTCANVFCRRWDINFYCTVIWCVAAVVPPL